MSNDLSASPYPPVAGLTQVQTWALALVPSEDNYTLIVLDPNASLGRAYLWLAVAGLVGGVISTLVSVGVDLALGSSTNPLLSSLGQGTPTVQGTLNGILFGVPIQTVLILVAVTIVMGVSQLLAKALGGRGTFTQLFYAFAAFFAPITLFNSLISSLPLVGLLFVIVTTLYGLLLNVVATETVQQFGRGRAILVAVVVPIGLVAVVAVIAYIGLAVFSLTLN